MAGYTNVMYDHTDRQSENRLQTSMQDVSVSKIDLSMDIDLNRAMSAVELESYV